ncbi:MAG: DUF4261 domain-containing protein [Clostridiales bacterium]|nr:DUF4261 domain-containing protein [Clostridiales bacterium]
MQFTVSDEANTIAIVCSHILEQGAPILYVSHDGIWQFLCGKKHSGNDARFVSLSSIYSFDSSVLNLADMPCGYYYVRKNLQSDWEIRKAENFEITEIDEENAGEDEETFAGFALLSDTCWNKNKLIEDLEEKWGMTVEEMGNEDDTLVFAVNDLIAYVNFVPYPIPGHEAEENASNNFLWPQAVEAAKAHKAHIVVAVMGNDDVFEQGKLYVKLLAACCRQENVLGIYTDGVVFEPDSYENFSDAMKNDELPVLNWIWFGVRKSKSGFCCYTYGMQAFGKDEMEIIDVDANPAELREFLINLASYVLENDVVLDDGQIVGFSENDKHKVTRSKGVLLPGITLKIDY